MDSSDGESSQLGAPGQLVNQYCTKQSVIYYTYCDREYCILYYIILCAILQSNITHTSHISRIGQRPRGSDMNTYCTILDILLQRSCLQMEVTVTSCRSEAGLQFELSPASD